MEEVTNFHFSETIYNKHTFKKQWFCLLIIKYNVFWLYYFLSPTLPRCSYTSQLPSLTQSHSLLLKNKQVKQKPTTNKTWNLCCWWGVLFPDLGPHATSLKKTNFSSPTINPMSTVPYLGLR